jgi:hypothetical protein
MRSNAIVIVRTMGLSQSLSCNRLAAVLILIASLLTISFLPLSGAQLANSNTTSNNGQIELFQPDSKPYGLSYADWTARLWQWAYSIPKDVNPSYDDTANIVLKVKVGLLVFNWYI